MAVTIQTEIERKYDVDENSAVPDFSSVKGITGEREPELHELDAVYFDTDRGDLAAHRIALRRRVGGADEGWHLKMPAELGRTEMQWPLDSGGSSDAHTPPPEVQAWLLVFARGRPFTELARIHTRRTTRLLLGEDHQPVIEFADDVVSATDVRQGSVRAWREWEAEIVGERRDGLKALDDVEKTALGAGARPSESRSKLAHALGRESLGAPSPSPRPVKPDSKASEVVISILASLTENLVRNDPLVRSDEPDSVHSMRTAVRRMNSLLGSSGDLFDDSAVTDLRDRLHRFGAVLGEARDLEVRAARAATDLDAFEPGYGVSEARERLVDDVLDDYAQAHGRAVDYMSRTVYVHLLDELDDFIDKPPLSAQASKQARGELAKMLRKDLRRTLKRAKSVREYDGQAPGSLAALHAVRKAARRLRYVAEALEDDASKTIGTSVAAIAAAAERVQDALGDHRDGVLFAENLLFDSNRAHAAGELTFVYGRLYERALSDADTALADLPEALDELKRTSRKL